MALRLFVSLSAALIAGGAFHARCRATGYYGPSEYFTNGGENVAATPEFYWELEVKRLASQFHPAEKRRVPAADPAAETKDGDEKEKQTNDQTTKADLDDFAKALEEGRIKPPDHAQAIKSHAAMREYVDGPRGDSAAKPPEEFESEFALYHRGALAYAGGGEDHFKEARAEWEKLLALPEAQRHYRSVWAAYMIGKTALKMEDPEAVKWFQRTRELAKAGFADSIGMAADSYGWEARSEWKQGHPEKAAPLYLTQLALGDETAIVSLKALIPDRDPVDGNLNFGPDPTEAANWTDEQRRAEEVKTLNALKTAAQDPILRRLVTAHILATSSTRESELGEPDKVHLRSKRWLGIIKEAKLGSVEDAEYLGWLAYNEGNYDDAARWLGLIKEETPAALWLRSKLERRAGKLNEAVESMAKAWEKIRSEASYTGWNAGVTDSYAEPASWGLPAEAGGDLGALRLERGDFVQSLEALWKAGVWEDAAFVAERVLTLDELKKYVDQQPVSAKKPVYPDRGEGTDVAPIRYLLGRRCVREDRYDDAAAYLPAPYDEILRIYVQALKDGADEKRSKSERAHAWFKAAWIARHDGMELMGFEGAPDSFNTGGDFESTDLAADQLRGTYNKITYVNGDEKREAVPIVLKVTKEERQRLEKNRPHPDIRFHYRVIAAALAMKAAKILPDNSEELADVINTAGGWVKDRDEKTADRYYQELKKRCAKTAIGRSAIAKHWFVDDSGPWSDAEQTANTEMHEKLDPKKPDQ